MLPGTGSTPPPRQNAGRRSISGSAQLRGRIGRNPCSHAGFRGVCRRSSSVVVGAYGPVTPEVAGSSRPHSDLTAAFTAAGEIL